MHGGAARAVLPRVRAVHAATKSPRGSANNFVFRTSEQLAAKLMLYYYL